MSKRSQMPLPKDGSVSETSSDAPYERTAEGSFVIAKTDEFVVEVTPMIFNWRVVVATPDQYQSTWEKGYCYFGTGLETLIRATIAAEEWAKGDPFTTDPEGYDKRAF